MSVAAVATGAVGITAETEYMCVYSSYGYGCKGFYGSYGHGGRSNLAAKAMSTGGGGGGL